MRVGRPAAAARRDVQVLVALDAVQCDAGGNLAGPLDQQGNAHAAFPGRALLAAIRGVTAVRPHHEFEAVVRGVDDDGVVFDTEVLELLEDGADLFVVLDHPGAHHILLGAPFIDGLLDELLGRVRPDVYRGRVEPHEEGLVALADAVQVLQRLVGHFLVEGLHALARQRTGVLDFLLADLAEFRIDGGIVGGGRPGVQHAARAKLLLVLGILLPRIVQLFRLFLGVEVVEIAEPFVEAVAGGQELVAIAQVVLAELRGGVADRLQHLGERRIDLLNAARRARNADGRHAGANRKLAHDESGATRSAARLRVVIREQRAGLRNRVDGRRAAHHAVRVRTDVPGADVVAKDDDDVRFLGLRGDAGVTAPSSAIRAVDRSQAKPGDCGLVAFMFLTPWNPATGKSRRRAARIVRSSSSNNAT